MGALSWLMNLGFAGSEDVVVGTINLTLQPRDATLSLEGRATLIDGALFPLVFPFFLDGSHIQLSLQPRSSSLTLESRP